MVGRTRAFSTQRSLERINEIIFFMGKNPTSLMQIADRFGMSRTAARDYMAHLVEFGCAVVHERISAEDYYIIVRPYVAGSVTRISIEPVRRAEYIQPFMDMKALPRGFFARM